MMNMILVPLVVMLVMLVLCRRLIVLLNVIVFGRQSVAVLRRRSRI